MEARIVLTTCQDKQSAKQLLHSLLELKLVACGNIVSEVTSMYWWKGQIEESAEALVIIKTDAKHVSELEQKLHQIHGYEVPEFVVIDPKHVSAKYLAWINSSLT